MVEIIQVIQPIKMLSYWNCCLIPSSKTYLSKDKKSLFALNILMMQEIIGDGGRQYSNKHKITSWYRKIKKHICVVIREWFWQESYDYIIHVIHKYNIIYYINFKHLIWWNILHYYCNKENVFRRKIERS